MTDNDIIKALECCTNSFYNGFAKCEECPKFTEMNGCTIKLMCNALDLINRQKAEIERLKAESNMADGYEDALVERTKSEAIKEFAERLKEKSWFDSDYEQWLIEKNDIDNLLEELQNGVKE